MTRSIYCFFYSILHYLWCITAYPILQPFRFLALFFVPLLEPPCSDVAVVTAERVSLLPARAGGLSMCVQAVRDLEERYNTA